MITIALIPPRAQPLLLQLMKHACSHFDLSEP